MSHDALDFAARIRDQGGRLTPQRQLVLDTLCALGGHVSVADLSDRVQAVAPAIDRSTVYRTLTLLKEMELVSAVTVDGVSVYEIAPVQAQPHAHLICGQCGHVEHVHTDLVSDLMQRLVAQHDFVMSNTGLSVQGLCRVCAASRQDRQASL